MIYARVHDKTVADDYYHAMTDVENRIAVANNESTVAPNVSELLAFVDRLRAEPLSTSQHEIVQTLRSSIEAFAEKHTSR